MSHRLLAVRLLFAAMSLLSLVYVMNGDWMNNQNPLLDSMWFKIPVSFLAFVGVGVAGMTVVMALGIIWEIRERVYAAVTVRTR
jgi:hypothetical protein